jgi:hypothetical protein
MDKRIKHHHPHYCVCLLLSQRLSLSFNAIVKEKDCDKKKANGDLASYWRSSSCLTRNQWGASCSTALAIDSRKQSTSSAEFVTLASLGELTQTRQTEFVLQSRWIRISCHANAA